MKGSQSRTVRSSLPSEVRSLLCAVVLSDLAKVRNVFCCGGVFVIPCCAARSVPALCVGQVFCMEESNERGWCLTWE